jgi:molybdopterin synthase sulfur carrier subunit
MIDVRYFANIRESLGVSHEQVSLPTTNTVAGLIAQLIAQHGASWQQAVGTTRVLAAVNHELVPHETTIKDGDEVAFFPPVTGG